jgi:hypothetical protein
MNEILCWKGQEQDHLSRSKRSINACLCQAKAMDLKGHLLTVGGTRDGETRHRLNSCAVRWAQDVAAAQGDEDTGMLHLLRRQVAQLL